jgi:hypothetical protein
VSFNNAATDRQYQSRPLGFSRAKWIEEFQPSFRRNARPSINHGHADGGMPIELDRIGPEINFDRCGARRQSVIKQIVRDLAEAKWVGLALEIRTMNLLAKSGAFISAGLLEVSPLIRARLGSNHRELWRA